MSHSCQECKFCSDKAMNDLNIDLCDHRAFRVYCGYFHQHEEQPSKDEFEEAYRGEFNTTGEFCEHLFSGCDDSYNDLNEVLQKFIDWEKVWDYSVQYDYVFEKGYVFRVN